MSDDSHCNILNHHVILVGSITFPQNATYSVIYVLSDAAWLDYMENCLIIALRNVMRASVVKTEYTIERVTLQTGDDMFPVLLVIQCRVLSG